MKLVIVGGASLALSACMAVPGVEGFDEVAAVSDVVTIVGVGPGRSGKLTVAPLGLTGQFKRSASTASRNGDTLSQGNTKLVFADGGEFGGLEADCAFSRQTFVASEPVGRRSTIETSTVTGPYVLTCGYFRNGQSIGGIEMREERGGAFDGRVLRSGRADVGSVEMELSSLHEIAGMRLQTGDPLGYSMQYRDGGEAMSYVNGSQRRIALPRDGRDRRAAALLSGTVLALVWDPGDGG